MSKHETRNTFLLKKYFHWSNEIGLVSDIYKRKKFIKKENDLKQN